ncbi:MAG: YbaB/EbfC family nucleoid-associated protein [Oscillospiraceae bacterium]|jgi:DNA-binding YbaB/EbfC family protein|nr:YbaB/EbfC family nucleoid-associated protein [Oscillospiraceae bacterium]
MKARVSNKGVEKRNVEFEEITKKAKKMQEEMQKATEMLEAKEYANTSSDGSVEAVVNGKFEIVKLDIKKGIVKEENREMICDFITVAINEALREAREERETVMDEISGGLDIPGGF